jgi:hypothetical protein
MKKAPRPCNSDPRILTGLSRLDASDSEYDRPATPPAAGRGWRTHHVDDGGLFQECVDCGKHRDVHQPGSAP